MLILLLYADPILRHRNAKECLESNLKRLIESENLFHTEVPLTKGRPKVRRGKELTSPGKGKEFLHMQTKFRI
jgi:hypothetical protein